MSIHTSVYKHSGQIGPAAYVVPIMGIIGAVLFSFAYAYIDVYSPIIGYITLLFILGFAYGISFVVAFAAKLGKCRNQLFMTISGFLISLFAVYTSWVIFLYALLKRFGEAQLNLSLMEMFLSPLGIWNTIAALAKDGWFRISSWQVSGTVLWILWGIEAVIIIAVVTMGSKDSISSSAFCERCSQWYDPEDAIFLSCSEDEAVMQQLQDGNTDLLETLKPANPTVYPHIRVDISSCKKCNENAGLQLLLVQQNTNSKGETKEVPTELTPILLIPYYKIKKLRNISNT